VVSDGRAGSNPAPRANLLSGVNCVAKEKTTLYLDKAVKARAEDLGLNLSKVAENALKAAIVAMETSLKTKQPLTSAAPEQGVVPVTMPSLPRKELIANFKRFLEVDLQREKTTVSGHAQGITRFLQWLGSREVTKDVLRAYLDQYRTKDRDTYANQLKSLKVFFRDFLGKADLVATFKFPSVELQLKTIPGKDKLKRFYEVLLKQDMRLAVLFLLWATSGWRRLEVLKLHRTDVDIEQRIMWPRVKSTATKGRLIGLFNEEAQDLLRKYLAGRKDKDPRLVAISDKTVERRWPKAIEACGFVIQPQLLRDWFCEAMSNLNVPDRYIDAFCGRVPKSVLAKHYTDYAPEKLKRIYDRAKLKVLS